MKELENLLNPIEPASAEHAGLATARIEQLTMPHWAMGRVLDLAVQLASIGRTLEPRVARKAVFVMAGDHGVADEGVSLYPREVTAQMVRNFVSGGAAISVLSRRAGARTVVVDAGVDGEFGDLVGSGQLVDGKIRRGTRNFAREPAMVREEAIRSVKLGFELARSYSAQVDVFATGDMGIANTTSSAAIAAALTGLPVEAIVGRGTGIDDGRLARKTRVIEDALARLRPDPRDGLDVLTQVGGYEIGAIAGLILGAAAERKPVLVDGYISTAGALLARALCPAAAGFMIASHRSAERGHALLCEALGKKPLLDLGLRLGEGTGAALAMPLVDAAAALLTEMATFESARVSRKKDLE